ncbi:MAG: exodeoxyribonuclease VII large subunit [Planctomycetes bacterium]|nr:exodeoxyribonuclease VII large subunit [Planctomycetota bacterium]
MPERSPFDPSRVRLPAAEQPPAAELPTTITVRQANELVRGALARHLPPTLHVLGEIGDLSRPTSGHVYFTLKDAQSELRAVMWRSVAARLKFTPEAGMEVIATGGIEAYAPRGSYQLIVRKLEPRGVGALEVAFRQLKARLEREGLCAAERKKLLPRVPRRVAIVTSPSGAALRDILQTLARRFPALEILVFPVRVQGEGAAAEIAAAIRLLNSRAAAVQDIDVAIVGRGGGSLEDLWAFNEEAVARAIASSRVPIVSAVGHEVDVSISDLVADLRAATPTAAAELITPRMTDLIDGLAGQVVRVTRAVRHGWEWAAARLETLLACDGLARPLARLQERGQLLDELQQRARAALSEQARSERTRLERVGPVLLRFGSGAHFARARQRLAEREYNLLAALGQQARRGERQWTDQIRRLHQAAPTARLSRADEHVRQAQTRLRLALRNSLARCRQALRGRMTALIACDPRRVLRRGYSITRAARTRRVLRSIADIRDRMTVVTELADGEFRSTADDPRQPGLFD